MSTCIRIPTPAGEQNLTFETAPLLATRIAAEKAGDRNWSLWDLSRRNQAVTFELDRLWNVLRGSITGRHK